MKVRKKENKERFKSTNKIEYNKMKQNESIGNIKHAEAKDSVKFLIFIFFNKDIYKLLALVFLVLFCSNKFRAKNMVNKRIKKIANSSYWVISQCQLVSRDTNTNIY